MKRAAKHTRSEAHASIEFYTANQVEPASGGEPSCFLIAVERVVIRDSESIEADRFGQFNQLAWGQAPVGFIGVRMQVDRSCRVGVNQRTHCRFLSSG